MMKRTGTLLFTIIALTVITPAAWAAGGFVLENGSVEVKPNTPFEGHVINVHVSFEVFGSMPSFGSVGVFVRFRSGDTVDVAPAELHCKKAVSEGDYAYRIACSLKAKSSGLPVGPAYVNVTWDEDGLYPLGCIDTGILGTQFDVRPSKSK